MIDNYRVVCVTPAGRQRYLSVLLPYILSSPIVDEYHLWLNTVDDADVEYILKLPTISTKIHVIEPPSIPAGSNPFTGIPQFFRNCIDDRTIYVRLDDDIVYLEPNFFETLLRFRVDNPDYFLVFPHIINNAICSYIQVKRKAIDADAPIYPWCMDWTAWWNPRFAEQIHRAFLRSVAQGEIVNWHFGPKLLAFTWFSINCMTWFGKDFLPFNGEVSGNEEEFLTILKPSELNRVNCIYGDTVAAHFAFYTQRDYLDSTDLLDSYASLREINPPQSGDAVVRSTDRNIWTERLLNVVSKIGEAQESTLTNVDFLADQIRQAGLTFDRRLLYGLDNQYMNAGNSGLWQIPLQLARCLVHLTRYEISTMFECGTGSGWTTAIVTAYLARFNDGFRIVTVDPGCFFKCYDAVKKILPIDYYPGRTSKDFYGQQFDLAFIDGDHSYDGCQSDYCAVGEKASICMFHDVNDKFVAEFESNKGGVSKFWHELKSQIREPDETVEFLDHSAGDRVMGIGVIVRANSVQERFNQ